MQKPPEHLKNTTCYDCIFVNWDAPCCQCNNPNIIQMDYDTALLRIDDEYQGFPTNYNPVHIKSCIGKSKFIVNKNLNPES